jgi:TolA-binding protein
MSPARASTLALVAALVLGANLAAAQAPSGPAAPGAVAGAPAGAPGDGAATTPRPSLPPPDLVPALRLVSPPLDKPAVPLPPIELPPSPQPFPPLPPPAVVSDLALRPSAPMSPPRGLACNPLGSVFGVASEQLECGRAKYQRAELEPALAEFQAVMQKSGDRDLVREARYWAAESLLRLGRRADVASHFEIVAKEDPGSDIGLYSRHELAWVLLERGEAARALEMFQSFLRGRVVPELVPIARHGRALSFHALQRYPEARDEWTSLLNTSLPRPLAAEASYWLGDSLGRLGDPAGAAQRLQVFTAAGPHVLIESGLMRLGWWRREAGQPLEAVKTYRGLLGAYPRTAEAPWVRAGLVRALLDLDDFAAAREEARRLQSSGRPGDATGSLALPTLLLLARHAVDKNRPEEAQPLLTELLGMQLGASPRAYVLVLSGESLRQAGQATDARDRFDAVRQAGAPGAFGDFAGVRLAQIDLEAREFAQARATAESLLGGTPPPAQRAAALLIAGEASYGLREYDRAAGFYTRYLDEVPTAPSSALVRLALGWSELRRERPAAAREQWERFAREAPDDPRLPAVLLLSAEMAARAGDEAGARALLDRLLARYPDRAPTEAATLNRAVLALRAGREADALRDLDTLTLRAPLSPFIGRIRLTRGAALLRTARVPDAEAEFRGALGEGEDGGRLGLGVVAFTRGQWGEATREWLAVRDAGAGPAAAAAEYGLAAAAFNQGQMDEFRRLAAPLLAGPPEPTITPGLLQGMAYLAAADKKWPEARTLTLRLADEFGKSRAAPAALATLGAAAARSAEWPIAREAYQVLATRYAGQTLGAEARLDQAEALLRTGAVPEARQRLEAFVNGETGDPQLSRALLLLAQSYEAAGEKDKALDVYARLRRDYPAAAGTQQAAFGQGRLLLTEGKWDEARPLLQKALDDADPTTAAEAAFRLGEGHRAAGQPAEAAQAYMTAAYLAPDSGWGQRALLGAGQAFVALKQSEAAVIVYRKLATAKGAEPELADAARKELKALGAN